LASRYPQAGGKLPVDKESTSSWVVDGLFIFWIIPETDYKDAPITQKEIPVKSTFTQEYLDVTERLRVAREKAKLKQEEVARQLGKTQSFVSKYECRERRLDIIEFIWVCQVVKIDPCRLIRDLVRSQEMRRLGRKSA